LAAMPLDYLRTERLRLFVWCNRCSRNASLDIRPFIDRLGGNFPVAGVGQHMFCVACCGHDIDSRPDWSDRTLGVVSRHF